MNVAQLFERAITGTKRTPNCQTPENARVAYINPALISIPAFHPRASFDAAPALELCASISKHGILHPVTVRLSDSGEYQIVCGARRLRSAKMLGLDKIPCIIVRVDENGAKEMCIEENRCRIPLEEKSSKEKSKLAANQEKTCNNMKETCKNHCVTSQNAKRQNIKISLKDGKLLVNSVNRLAELAKNCGADSTVEVFPAESDDNAGGGGSIFLKIFLPPENHARKTSNE